MPQPGISDWCVFNALCCCNPAAGEPGVGKTLLVERVMSSLQQRFNTDAANPTVGVVRLNGYVHGDDR
jgi:hypothetical protein